MAKLLSRVGKVGNLGQAEQIILTAILMAGENAYGVTIHEKVDQILGGHHRISTGAVYVTLERLEQKGFCRSWFSEPTPGRGGRAKRFYEITAPGSRALDNSIRLSTRIVDGLRGIGALGDPNAA